MDAVAKTVTMYDSAGRWGLLCIRHQPDVVVFGLDVVPEHRVDVEMDQPCGRFSLLANLFLIAVGDDRYLVAGCARPIVMSNAVIKNGIDPCFFSAGIFNSFGVKQGFQFRQ